MLMQISSSQLGINIHLAGIRHFGLDEKKTVATLLSLPYQHVRIPIPFDEIAAQKGRWDFSKRDWLIEEASKKGKTIHLQFGAKTIGWPEVWLPQWLTDAHPYIHKAHACIDHNKEVQTFLLEALEKSAERYLRLPNVISIQVENEAFCKRLSVSNYRYISFPFHKRELEVIRQYNTNNCLILQNLPLNHPLDLAQALPYVLRESDIIGLNIYNQHIPYGPYQKTNNIFLSTVMRFLKPVVSLKQKQIYITELQSTAWLRGNNTPIKPFSLPLFEKTVKQYLTLGADIVFLWDVEQILALGTSEHKKLLDNLSFL